MSFLIHLPIGGVGGLVITGCVISLQLPVPVLALVLVQRLQLVQQQLVLRLVRQHRLVRVLQRQDRYD